MTRILIADDHAVVRVGIRQMLRSNSAWDVVGEAVDGLDAVDQALFSKPDVVVLDYSLPLMNGIEVTAKIMKTLPSTRILIFSMLDNEVILNRLLQEGIKGYLLKSEAPQYLLMTCLCFAIFHQDKFCSDKHSLQACNPVPG